ncbi:MAG: hypothetical protein K2J20_03530, partial [Bacilli bacterium]|nr:hypothetical protein [Bacilli bacterium]
MKKIFISYYAVAILVIFIIRNILLANLIISGLLYNVFMLIFLVLDYLIIRKYKNIIKWKIGIIILSFFLLIFSQDIFQLLFILSNMIILMGSGYLESRLLRIVTIVFLGLSLVLLLLILSSPFILWIFIYSLFLNTNGNDIYEDMHYYCENNIEVYAYSSGAMDKYH